MGYPVADANVEPLDKDDAAKVAKVVNQPGTFSYFPGQIRCPHGFMGVLCTGQLMGQLFFRTP